MFHTIITNALRKLYNHTQGYSDSPVEYTQQIIAEKQAKNAELWEQIDLAQDDADWWQVLATHKISKAMRLMELGAYTEANRELLSASHNLRDAQYYGYKLNALYRRLK